MDEFLLRFPIWMRIRIICEESNERLIFFCKRSLNPQTDILSSTNPCRECYFVMVRLGLGRLRSGSGPGFWF